MPSSKPQPIKAKSGPSATKEFIRRTCASNIRDALSGGVTASELIKLLAEEVALATGLDAKQILLAAAGS